MKTEAEFQASLSAILARGAERLAALPDPRCASAGRESFHAHNGVGWCALQCEPDSLRRCGGRDACPPGEGACAC